jgi:hypothetical protein
LPRAGDRRRRGSQLITLSTGIIALTITFLKDVVHTAPAKASRYLKTSWVLYCLNVLLGIMALMAIAGTLGSDSATKDVYQLNISMWVGLQVFTFLSGTSLVIAFGSVSLNDRSKITEAPAPPSDRMLLLWRPRRRRSSKESDRGTT